MMKYDDSKIDRMAPNDLWYLIHHVFLPPKLPKGDEEDGGVAQGDYVLLNLLEKTASKHVSGASAVEWQRVKDLIRTMRELHTPPTNQRGVIQRMLSSLSSGDVIAMHIRAQNAGVIIHHKGEALQWELFEVSPRNTSTIGCEGRLICSYPGPTISVPRYRAQDPEFISEVSAFLSSMSSVCNEDAIPHVRKAGEFVPEARDTVDPRYITELLTGILRGCEGNQTKPGKYLAKHIRDDVCWESEYLPWRRSPLWLVVRVALQSTFTDNNNYKLLMIEFMSEICSLSLDAGVDSDTLSIMVRKLGRRALKIGDKRMSQQTLDKVKMILVRVPDTLESRWSLVKDSRTRKIPWDPSKVFDSDTNIILGNTAKSYIESRMDAYRNATDNTPVSFHPNQRKRYRSLNEFIIAPSPFEGTSELDKLIALMDFENCFRESVERGDVAKELELLLFDNVSVIKRISELMEAYSCHAPLLYKDNPEANSVFILTMMELWCEMDKATCRATPLLEFYSPELSVEIFEALLLSKFRDMERLHKVEEYIKRRQNKSRSHNRPNIFDESNGADSFPVQYYDASKRHKDLRRQIEEEALIVRQAKIDELKRSQQHYNQLVSEADRLSCAGYWNDYGSYVHPWHCRRCNLYNQANSIYIKTHEWPLPLDENRCKRVIFEISPDEAVSIWRDATYHLFMTAFKTERDDNNGSSQGSFEDIPELKHRVKSDRRITLASTSKSWYVAHYQVLVNSSTEEEDVCGKCAMHYELYNAHRSEWAANRFQKADLRPLCKIELQGGPYKRFEYAVNGTEHATNHVIAKQNSCPREFTLDEYHAFCSLRSGSRLQWRNILIDLASPALSFKREEVHDLILAASCQVGSACRAAPLRDDHSDLENPNTCLTLLDDMKKFLQGVRENWQECVAVKTLILVAKRILSSKRDITVIKEALSFLSFSREVTLRWTREVVAKLQEVDADCDARHERNLIVHIAAICRMTFDSEHHYQEEILRDDLATYLECGLYINDNSANIYSNLPKSVQSVLMRDLRCAVALQPIIHKLLSICYEPLDKCVASLWTQFTSDGPWHRLAIPNERWYSTKTQTTQSGTSQVVHLNVLENQLLVDGQPLGKLPSEMVSHPTYRRILNKRVLDVIPSDMKSMTFQTKRDIFGLNMHFAGDGNSLYIRTISQDQTVHELIPDEVLQDEFATPLWKNSSHWLNLKSGEIEFRRLTEWWIVKPKDFVLSSAENGLTLQNCDETAIHLRSKIVEMVASTLEGIEERREMLITRVKEDNRIQIKLPRYKLEFFCHNGSLEMECQTIADHVVDVNQDIETFYGLENMLVLCQKDDIDRNSHRLVIVPRGTASAKRPEDCPSHHPIVTITTKGDARSYYVYKVDTRLGRLVDDGRLSSRFTRIHLHALTSHCLPDPLTMKRGTVEALQELRSAGSFSFKSLHADEFEILKRISKLTPSREYYPHWTKSMQTAIYDKNLPTLSQHDDFYPAVEAIVEHWAKLEPFCGKQSWTSGLDKSKPSLRRRAALRNGNFSEQTASCNNFDSSHPHDVVYEHRHFPANKENDVWEITSLVFKWPQRLDMETSLANLFKEMPSTLLKNQAPYYQRLSYSVEWLRLPVQELWMNLYDLCRHANRQNDTYGLIFVLSALYYSPLNKASSNALVKTLLAFATNTSFSTSRLAMPPHVFYPLSKGKTTQRDAIRQQIERHTIEFHLSDESSLPSYGNESNSALWKRRNNTFERNCGAQANNLVRYFERQWPTRAPSRPSDGISRLFNISPIMTGITDLFKDWHINKDFFDYLSKLEIELRSMRGVSGLCAVPFADIKRSPKQIESLLTQPIRSIGLFDLFNRETPKGSRAPDIEHVKIEDYEDAKGEITGKGQLESLLDRVEENSDTFGQQYVRDMRASLDAWRLKSNELTPSKIHILLEDTVENSNDATKHAVEMFGKVVEALSPMDKCESLLQSSGLWPEISPRALLETLQLQNRNRLPKEWRDVILRFGEMMTLVQKSERMLRSVRSRNSAEFQREAENPGQVGWDSSDYPDWLLIELESDILIRPVQATIAEEMMEPSEGVNSVTQLNMGEGKSSVILPCTSASLADGSRLVRPVVLKPLADQMFNLLRHKLSGLVNRRIYYLPFSRDLDPNIEQIEQLQNIYEECKDNGSILLSLPEHILSMKLMGIDKSIRGSDTAESLLSIQKWVDENVRDILDESDEILHVRYQLIYTVGAQQLPEGGSDRWMILREILNLFRIRATEYQRENPRSVEVSHEDDDSKFPSIRILTDQAGKDIMNLVKNDIFDGKLPFISSQMCLLTGRDVEDAKKFVMDLHVERRVADRVKENDSESNALYQYLLLLRGLIAHEILLFVFKEKRYRVDYGLDSSRKNYNLAVPYRAKDVPATRAELAHIDVLLMLTYLSHYAEGLSDEDIYLCFEQLLKSDNPEQTYEDWISVCKNAPVSLQKLRGVNLEDKAQFTGVICPLLTRNRAVIDFYLAALIFPKQVKEFPEKICANGWDLAGKRPNIRDDGKRFVTGFSGTNDNRYLLPTTIQQQDQEGLLHTNAMVLEHILKAGNGPVIHAHRDGQRLKAKELLDLVVQQSPAVNVILDVGAQVLELTNEKVIRKWLKRHKDRNIKGGIYFNDNDELTIMNRDGSIEGFTGSATMAQQMSKYIVYLDEAHTRGTDLKLPLGSRAVVTLGPKLVKDKFVQGCMRMRKLASGHSLVFFAPPEVYHSILPETKKKDGDKLKTIDVLDWTMLESCKQIEHNFPNWASQGFQYDKRCKGWEGYHKNGNIEDLKAAMLEPERRSLEEMYGPRYDERKCLVLLKDVQGEIVQKIFSVCREFNIKSLRNVEAEEEQEREVEQERERERLIERPPDVAAAKHSVHPVIRNYVRTGSISITPKAVHPAFSLFERTSVRNDFHMDAWSQRLLASDDFIETVQLEADENMDHYIRPVRWILSSGSSERTFVLISPHEANELIRDIQKSNHVRLHMYTPRTSRSPLLNFEDLDVCPTPKAAISPVPLIPADVSMQLNLFAGQLFLKDFDTYQSVCKFLGLHLDQISTDNENFTRMYKDGFLSREERSSLEIDGAEELVFNTSPIKFIQGLFDMRRKGMGYISSHMGGVVHARKLQEHEF